MERKLRERKRERERVTERKINRLRGGKDGEKT